MKKKDFKRQQKVEQSPNRTQELDPAGNQSAPRDHSQEKREGRGSPPPLNRPHSFPPLDPQCLH